jgi:hypothetical protein
MNNKIILSAAASLILLGSVVSIPVQAYAANGFMGGGNFFSNLITFISQKFGLDKTLVQNAVTEFQNQQKAYITPRPTLSPQEIQDREKQRLDPLVKSGKITQDQENAIITEQAALNTKYPFTGQRQMTADQRKTLMTNRQNDWTTWAKANGIDPTIVGQFGMGGPGVKRGFGRGKMMNGNQNPPPLTENN